MKAKKLGTISDKTELTNLGDQFIENLKPKNPGDELNMRITKNGTKVATAKKNNGNEKYSITQYSNGTTHLTKTIKSN